MQMPQLTKQRKILIFSHSSLLGGAERSMIDLIDALSTQSFSVLVVLPGRGIIEKLLNQKSIPFLIIRYCWWASVKKVAKERYLESLHNLVSSLPRISRFNPDCIITNTAVIPWGMLSALFLNVPHIWNIREFVVKDHGLIPEVTFPELAKIIYLGSEKIWFVSRAVRDEFEKYAPHDKSEVIYSHVTIPKLPIYQKYVLPYKYENSFKVIMPSNIYPSKGQDQAVKAVINLIDKNYNVELLLQGRKSKEEIKYLKRIEKLIGVKYKNRIHILGFTNDPYTAILKSNLVVVCSRSEAFPRVLIESGLLGKTFVASNTGGNLEIGNDGLFYRYDDFMDLADKIRYLIDNPLTYKKLSKAHQKNMQIKYGENPVFSGIIPEQLMITRKESKFTSTFDLIRKIVVDSYEKNKLLDTELRSIKSSKGYKVWRKYHKFKDLVAETFRHNE